MTIYFIDFENVQGIPEFKKVKSEDNNLIITYFVEKYKYSVLM